MKELTEQEKAYLYDYIKMIFNHNEDLRKRHEESLENISLDVYNAVAHIIQEPQSLLTERK